MQSRKVPTLDVHISLAQFEERVIVSDVHKHIAALADATRAYAEATSSSVRFWIPENECMAKELQAVMQREEKSTGFSRAEMNKSILAEVSTLETITQRLYDIFVNVNKAIFHLHGHQ